MTKAQQANIEVGQGVCERKSNLVTYIYNFLTKTKEELYGFSPGGALGTGGEKYLHIPAVT